MSSAFSLLSIKPTFAEEARVVPGLPSALGGLWAHPFSLWPLFPEVSAKGLVEILSSLPGISTPGLRAMGGLSPTSAVAWNIRSEYRSRSLQELTGPVR